MYDDTILPDGGTLIWSDIHHYVDKLNSFLERHGDKFPKRILLGDYFDDFDDTTIMATKTARAVKAWLADPRNHLCLGNHDIPYMFPWIRELYCPGYDPDKRDAISQILSMDDWAKMKLAFVEQGWLISHAGVHVDHLSMPFVDKIEPHHVLELCDYALEKTHNGHPPSIMLPGNDRGFRYQRYGGIYWLDWRSFKPIPGINQIVGHSPLVSPMVAYRVEDSKHTQYAYLRSYKGFPQNWEDNVISQNWNLDTKNNHFGVLKDSKLFIYPTIHFM